MKDARMTAAALRQRLSMHGPPGRQDTGVPGVRREKRSGAASIFPVSKDSATDTRSPGAKYLNDVLNDLGFTGNAELSRLTGVREGSLWKWRNDGATPTAQNLRKIVSVIMPLARAAGLPVNAVEFYVRFELITWEEIEPDPVDDLYIELLRLDRETGDMDADLQRRMRESVSFIVDSVRQQLADKRTAKPSTGRNRKTG
jgi:hypothetical protein